MSRDPDSSNLSHVAIIMDGNGRWAKKRSHLRVWGHVRGSLVVSDIVQEASDRGIAELTLYAFSTENWSRPISEVRTLFNLLKKFLLRERKRLIDNHVLFRVVGDISVLPHETIALIKELEETTRFNQGIRLNFAFNYGGRKEIVEAINKVFDKNEKITEENIQDNLDLPEVDLLIRTGGEKRISNFLLWQMAYSELYFTDTMWPDFTKTEFSSIIEEYNTRERRFGNISRTSCLEKNNSVSRKNKELIISLRDV
jgi:undecaprenyl diphosphate synthase